MVRLDNDAFLDSLRKLFQVNKSKGSVVMTMKRYDGKTKAVPKSDETAPPPSEYMCLLRAYCNKNKKQKISTVVHQKEVIKFQMAYSNLLKTSMDGLKKSKKAKKAKA